MQNVIGLDRHIRRLAAPAAPLMGLALLTGRASSPAYSATNTAITVDGTSGGRTFDGVGAGGTSDGTPIVQRTDQKSSSKQWKLAFTSGGYLTITGVGSGKALDSNAAST